MSPHETRSTHGKRNFEMHWNVSAAQSIPTKQLLVVLLHRLKRQQNKLQSRHSKHGLTKGVRQLMHGDATDIRYEARQVKTQHIHVGAWHMRCVTTDLLSTCRNVRLDLIRRNLDILSWFAISLTTHLTQSQGNISVNGQL